MRFTKLLPYIAVILLLIGCFLPWMTIESKGITITGLNTTGTSYGKPAWFHFVWAALYIFFILFNKVWAKRAALGVAAFNVAWSLRNFLLLPACQMGDCPVKQEGLYLLLSGALLMFMAPLLPQNTTKPIEK